MLHFLWVQQRTFINPSQSSQPVLIFLGAVKGNGRLGKIERTIIKPATSLSLNPFSFSNAVK